MSAPGKVEPYGWIEFTEGHSAQVDVSLEDDGSITIEWTEKSDDCWGTNTRRVGFSAEEFEQIVHERAAYMARSAL